MRVVLGAAVAAEHGFGGGERGKEVQNQAKSHKKSMFAQTPLLLQIIACKVVRQVKNSVRQSCSA